MSKTAFLSVLKWTADHNAYRNIFGSLTGFPVIPWVHFGKGFPQTP